MYSRQNHSGKSLGQSAFLPFAEPISVKAPSLLLFFVLVLCAVVSRVSLDPLSPIYLLMPQAQINSLRPSFTKR